MKSIDLYRVVIGSDVWTMTNADQDQYYNAGFGSERYEALTIERTEIEQKNEITKASITVNIPIDYSLSLMILTNYKEQVMSLTVFTDRDGDISVSWKGRLSNFQPGDSYVAFVFESIFTSLRRPGLRATFQKNCRHALYGRGCRINPEDYDVSGVLNTINGTVLTVPDAALEDDGYYTNGMIAASDGVLSYIINHVGDQITVQRVSHSLHQTFADVGPGVAVKIYPGCDHSRGTCNGKFANLLNYGGFDWIPDQNPMDGTSIV